MSMEKTAEFLADCLSHMPPQPEQLQRAVDTVIAGLTRIANGGEWPEEQARAASRAAWAAARAAAWAAASSKLDAAWAAARAAVRAAAWAAASSKLDAAWSKLHAAAALSARWAAAWAAAAHPDPDAERARQAKVREKLGLNTEGA